MRVPKEKHSVFKMECIPCMESAPPPPEHSELAAAGSTVPPADIRRLVTSTQVLPQSHYEQGSSQHKAVAEESTMESQYEHFFHSGLAAIMEDQQAARMMLEKAIPVIHSGKGKFAFLYTKDLAVKHSCFELNSNFKLQRHCGKGGSAEVSAFLDENKFSFVRKRMEVQYFRKEEVEVMLKLDHPGVCKVLAVLCHGHTIDLLLQDAGHSLKQVLQTFTKRGMTDQQYQQVMEDLGRQGFETLRYIHQQGVCHLDIKPENLLVRRSKQGRLVLVLVDFGSSRYVGDIMMPDDRTTPEYWPPEMWHFFTRHQSQKRRAPSMLGKESELVALPQKETDRFVAAPEIDTAAMGMVLYFIGTQQHFILAERDFPEKAVPSEEVEMLRKESHGKLESRHIFNLLLMTKYSHRVPNLTTRGHWVCSSIPNTVQAVIRGTLKPDPKQRLKDEQAVSILSRAGQSGTVACEEKQDPGHDIPVNKREMCCQVRPELNEHIPGKASQHSGCQPSQNKLLNHMNDAMADAQWNAQREFITVLTQDLTAAKPSALEPLTAEPPLIEPLASKLPSVKPLAAEPQASEYLAPDHWQPSRLNQLLAPLLAPWDVNIRVSASQSFGMPVHTFVNTPACAPDTTLVHPPVNTSIYAPIHLATHAQTSMLQDDFILRTDSSHATTCVTQQQRDGQRLHLDDQNQAQGQGHLDDQGKGQRFHLNNKLAGQWPDIEGEAEGDTSIDYDVELDFATVVEAQHTGVPDTQPLTHAWNAQDKVQGLRPGNHCSDFQAFSPQADITCNMNSLSLQPSIDPPFTHPLPLHQAAPERKEGGGGRRPVLKTHRGVVGKPVHQSPPLKSSRKRSFDSPMDNDPAPKLLFTVASSGRHKPRVHALPVPPSSLPAPSSPSPSPVPPSSSPVQPEMEDTAASVTHRWQPDMVASGLLLGQQPAYSYDATRAVSKPDAAAAVSKPYPKVTAGSRCWPNSFIIHQPPTNAENMTLHCSDGDTGTSGKMMEEPLEQTMLLELNQLLEANHFYDYEAAVEQLQLEEPNGCAGLPHPSQVWADPSCPSQECTKLGLTHPIPEWVGPDLSQVCAEPESPCPRKERMQPDPACPGQEWVGPGAPHPTYALAESYDLLLPGQVMQGQLDVHREEASLPNFDMIIG